MMKRKTAEQIEWAPRVKPHTIRRLYELDAKGILDENLIDEVGFGLWARCETIHRVTHRLCPECGGEVEEAWDDHSKYRKISCKVSTTFWAASGKIPYGDLSPRTG